MSKDPLRLTPEQRAVFDALLARQGIAPASAEQSAIAHDAAARFEPFPMTEVQASYLLGRDSHFELGGVASHGYQEFECAELDISRYEEAWNRVIAHHDMLRAIALPDATQVVLPQVPRFQVAVMDLRGKPLTQQLEVLDTLRDEMSHHVPDPYQWPCFEVRVSLLDGGRARIHFGSDALWTDIFGASAVQRDVLRCYGDPSCELPSSPYTFRDYVLHEQAQQTTPAFREAERYWRDKLDRFAPAPELPLVPLNTVTQPRFSRRAFEIEESTALRALAQDQDVTPSALLLAAYIELLRRFAGHEAFTLNLTVFQRPAQAERVVGDFTSTLLFAVPEQRATFAGRLRDVQAALLEDLDHCQVSGIRVGRELAARQRRTGMAAMPVVFTSMLGLGRLGARLEAGQQLGTQTYMITQTPQVVLDHQLYEGSDGRLRVVWDLVEEAFLPGVVDAMFEAYQTLLRRLSRADASLLVSNRTVELPGHHFLARQAANATLKALPSEPLHTGFRRHCVAAPERIALVSGERRWSYGELGALVSGLVHRLQGFGVERGSLVALVMQRGVEQVVGALGVLESGGAYVPMDASQPPARLLQLLTESGATHVVTQPWLQAQLAWPDGVTVYGLALEALDPQEASTSEPAAVGADDVAYVIYTSGSTGRPKGVVVTHGAAQNTIADVNRRFKVGPSDRVLGLSSLSFDLSVYDIFGVLGAGGCLVQVEAGAERDPSKWAELMAREGVTLWNSVPALMQMLLDWFAGQGAQHRSPLRCALLSGDWLPLALAEQLRQQWPAAQVVSLGGATEASIWSIFHLVRDVQPGWSSVPYGTPLSNQRWYVLNDGWEDCPDGVAGELYIGGSGLAQGYHRDPERTARQFLSHPQTGERLYRTGDWGRYRPGGVLEFLGRKDGQVKVGGHRIELGEIEAVLAAHGSVGQVLVQAVGNPRSAGKRLVGYVVLKQSGSVDMLALQAYVAERLPGYMVPRALMELERLPLTDNGKVDRAALPEPARAPCGIRPRTDIERRIAAQIQQLFALDDVSSTDSFFDMGLDSMGLVKLATALASDFSQPLPVAVLFDHGSIALLGIYLEAQTASEDAVDTAMAKGQARRRRRVHSRGRQADATGAGQDSEREP